LTAALGASVAAVGHPLIGGPGHSAATMWTPCSPPLLPQRVVGVKEGEQLGRGDGAGAGGRGPVRPGAAAFQAASRRGRVQPWRVV